MPSTVHFSSVTMNNNNRFCLDPKLKRVKRLMDKIMWVHAAPERLSSLRSFGETLWLTDRDVWQSIVTLSQHIWRVYLFLFSFQRQQPKIRHICTNGSQLGFNFQNHNSSMIFFFSTSWTSSSHTHDARHTHTKSTCNESRSAKKQSSILVNVFFIF